MNVKMRLSQHKKKRIIFVVTILAISLLALLFVVSNFRDSIVFFYSPQELFEQKIAEKVVGKTVRVGGLVKENSVRKISNFEMEFVVTDLKAELKIRHNGLVPDLFRDRQGVVVEGVMNWEERVFLSKQMLIKHDENYMPPEVKGVGITSGSLN